MNSADDFRPRVLVTKIGLDGHDRGSRIVAAACRDAGMEVIYTPPWQSIAAVVKLALEEDVDVIGISSLATDHLIVPKLMAALREAGLGNVRVVVGGIVPDNEEVQLLEAGVREVFHPGSTMDEITDAHARLCAGSTPRRRGRGAAEPPMNRTPTMHRTLRVDPRPTADRPASHRRGAAPLEEREYSGRHRATDRAVENVSGIPIRPLYTPQDWRAYGTADPLGYPGQPDYTRGIYATMHRGRTWTQRQLVGLGTPADYNERLLGLLDRGATAVSLIPCNSVYRGYDMDSVEPELLGTCGVVVNNVDHMDRCLAGRRCRDGVVRDERSVAVHAARLHAGRGGAARHRLEDGSPARRTRATTCRTTSPTTCSTGSRCRGRGAC